MTIRPSRRMPTAVKVAQYWHDRGEPFTVCVDEPACFGCGLERPAWNGLERAHLINRGYGGLDHAGNLAMLCHRCHRLMPNFDIDQIDAALDYAANSGWHIFEYLVEACRVRDAELPSGAAHA